MRLASATGFVVAAMLATGCAGRGIHPAPARDTEIVAKLKNLGIEGRTYQNDLGAVQSIFVKDVYTVDDDLLIEDIHGHLTYVDGPSMNPRWDYYGMPKAFDEKPDFTPASIVGVSGGKLFVITRFNGTEGEAPSPLGLVPSAAPVATESTLYVPTYATPGAANNLSSVSLGSGYVGWGRRTGADATANLAKGGPLGGDTIYMATTDGSLYAFPTDMATEPPPQPAWSASARSPIFFDLVVDGDDLGVVTADARAICYDRSSGQVRWDAAPNAGDRPESSLQFSLNHAFVRMSGELRAYDRATGAKAWTLKGGRSFLAERDGYMLIGGDHGMVYRVDSKTGAVAGHEHLDGVTIVPRTAQNGTIHAITDKGLMIAVEYGW